jgi:hypothetical protein
LKALSVYENVTMMLEKMKRVYEGSKKEVMRDKCNCMAQIFWDSFDICKEKRYPFHITETHCCTSAHEAEMSGIVINDINRKITITAPTTFLPETSEYGGSDLATDFLVQPDVH